MLMPAGNEWLMTQLPAIPLQPSALFGNTVFPAAFPQGVSETRQDALCSSSR